MTEEHKATPEALVVAFEATEGTKVSEGLAEIGPVSSLGPGGLALVRPSSPGRDARAAWSDLLRRCPGVAWAAPALRDTEGHELLPTGSVVVRFRQPTSDEALKAFAADLGLALESRNEFVPRQATFRPLRPREVYLPELAGRVAARSEVEHAFAGTVSRYRRA